MSRVVIVKTPKLWLNISKSPCESGSICESGRDDSDRAKVEFSAMEQSDRVRSSDKKCVSSDKKLKFFEEETNSRSLSSLRVLDFTWGSLLIVNFLVVWSIPITIQGLIWKHTPVSKIAKYVHDSLGASTRKWAATFLYSRTRYSDYCATSLLIFVSSIISIGAMLYFQLNNPGHLPPSGCCALCFSFGLVWWTDDGRRVCPGSSRRTHSLSI